MNPTYISHNLKQLFSFLIGSYHPREETTGGRVHTTLSTITVYVIMDDNGATYTCEAIHKALTRPLRARITIDVLCKYGVFL